MIVYTRTLTVKDINIVANHYTQKLMQLAVTDQIINNIFLHLDLYL